MLGKDVPTCIIGCFISCSLLVKILPIGRHLLGRVSIKVGLEWVSRGLNSLVDNNVLKSPSLDTMASILVLFTSTVLPI